MEKKIVCMLYKGRLENGAFLISWSNFIMVPCAAFNASELNLMWIKDGTGVLPHWTDFEQKSQSEWEEWVSPGWILTWKTPLLLFLAVEWRQSPKINQCFKIWLGRMFPSSSLVPRDLNALTSSRDSLGQSIVSDSCTSWKRCQDFSGFRGGLSCYI